MRTSIRSSLSVGVLCAALLALIGATVASPTGALQAQGNAAAGYIGGVVQGPKGPEAGVWVIAETKDLPTNFIKIVVTDDQGRFMVPDLPPASYAVWVRGYGLVDSRTHADEARYSASDIARRRGCHSTRGGQGIPGQLLALADGPAAEDDVSRHRASG